MYHKVPTDANQLSDIKLSLNDSLLLKRNVESITTKCVIDAISKLKQDKSDSSGLNTNHFRLGGNRLAVYLGLLYTSMLVHGYTVDELLFSTVVPIPKNPRASLSDSNNYRGIALCSCLSKILDTIILTKYNHLLCSSDLQFAYKEKLGTTMCTLILKETINYFVNRHTDVYCCLLDASKAFDCVHYGHLFSMLIDKGLPKEVIRLLLDSYTRQTLCTKWNDTYSKKIDVCNGVKQGGVLSPILFAVYYDVLLNSLKTNISGCRIGNDFVGALCYADDLVLVSPSRVGLQDLVNECVSYSSKYKVSFNKNKSVAIKFGNNCKSSPLPIKILNDDIIWKSTVTHLGNSLRSSLSDDSDIDIKIGQFYGQVNKIIANFRNCSSSVLKFLFRSYCSSFHGSQAWNLNLNAIRKVETAWNKAVRRVLNIPLCTHRYLLPHLVGQRPIFAQFCTRFANLLFAMLNVDLNNSIVYNCARRLLIDSNSIIGSNVICINSKFNLNIVSQKYCYVKKCINVKSMALSIEQRATLDTITELNEYNTILDSSELTLLLNCLYVN